MRKNFLISFFVMTAFGFFSLLFFLMNSPELGRLSKLSNVIRSYSGETINLRLTSSGHWREPADLNRIDPLLIKMLVAYEDKRFWHHHGVDHMRSLGHFSVLQNLESLLWRLDPNDADGKAYVSKSPVNYY